MSHSRSVEPGDGILARSRGSSDLGSRSQLTTLKSLRLSARSSHAEVATYPISLRNRLNTRCLAMSDARWNRFSEHSEHSDHTAQHSESSQSSDKDSSPLTKTYKFVQKVVKMVTLHASITDTNSQQCCGRSCLMSAPGVPPLNQSPHKSQDPFLQSHSNLISVGRSQWVDL